MSGQQSASENLTKQQSSGTNGQHNVHAFVNALSGIQLGHYGGPHQASDYPTNGGSGGSGNRNNFNIRAPARAQSHIHQVEDGMPGASCSSADQYVARQTPQGPQARNEPGSSFCNFNDFPELPGTSNSAGGSVGEIGSSWVQRAEGAQKSDEISFQGNDFLALPPHLRPSFGLQDLHLAFAKIVEEARRKNQSVDESSSTISTTPSLTPERLSGNSYFAEPYVPLNQRQRQALHDAGSSDFILGNDPIYHSHDGAYHPKVKQDPIGTKPVNRSRAGSSDSGPAGMGRQGQHQEASSSGVPLPSGSKSPQTDNHEWGILSMVRSTLGNKGNPNSIHRGVGIDLATLGVDFASESPLFRTFASPWAEKPLKEEPKYSIPACYNENQPPPMNYGRISKMSEEELFYIFYSMPKDVYQLYAAHALATRGWMYHRGLYLWLIKDPNLMYFKLAENRERGSYICFNPNAFVPTRKKDFILDYDMIEPIPQLPPINRS